MPRNVGRGEEELMDEPRAIENFEQLHELPPEYEVVDAEGNAYRRNRDGVWADRHGYFPSAGALARLLPIKPRLMTKGPEPLP
jgi:hypothetical protein